MSKIIFFDIDGTLLDEEKKLPDSTKWAIKKLQENGIYTAIATGRAPFMVKPLLKELDIESYVSFNGQFVVFEDNIIYSNPLDPNHLQRLETEASKHQHPLVYMTESTLKANVPYDERVEKSLGTLFLDHPDYDPNYYEKHTVYQALLFANEAELDYVHKFEEHQTFIRWHEVSVDVIPKGGSKANGIEKLIDKLGFQVEDVIAFGDALNDIEMIQTVGTGVAMGNALDTVKKHADLVTDSVKDDGILNGLKKLGLI